MQFIQKQSNTVLLIASSVGSFCELGLFSHQHVQENARQTDFILILDEKYKDNISYLNEGPAKPAYSGLPAAWSNSRCRKNHRARPHF